MQLMCKQNKTHTDLNGVDSMRNSVQAFPQSACLFPLHRKPIMYHKNQASMNGFQPGMIKLQDKEKRREEVQGLRIWNLEQMHE